GEKISAAFGIPLAAPVEMIASLYTVPFEMATSLKREDLHGFRDKIFSEYKIEIPAMTVNGKAYLRFSANVYNYSEEYDALIAVLKQIFGGKS
ncbi:MAG TPA: hypothetical protein VFO76_12725, partial [Candidatus Kapabacteria bacterium]|nr:hypothetical protein [Candidatus Kapabacteria bacterium]